MNGAKVYDEHTHPLIEPKSICFSGGAPGSDYYWSFKGQWMGHRVMAYTFAGHQFHGNEQWKALLTKEQLDAALPHVKLAGIKLRREGALSANWYTKALMCRNYYQVVEAGRCYAIGRFSQAAKGLHDVIDGGTAWAVQMFIDKHHGAACPVYFYDLNEKWWYSFDGQAWQACFSLPPVPEGPYAGIGTRKFDQWGRKAIDDLFRQVPKGSPT